MQYKIPVQIENDDPILLGLWLKQLAVIMIWGWIAFSVFDSLRWMWTEIAAIPWVIIFWITILIAVFKHSEMTFIPFILSIFRTTINWKERRWIKWVDSFQPIDIGYITNIADKKDNKISFESKFDKLKNLEDKINKI